MGPDAEFTQQLGNTTLAPVTNTIQTDIVSDLEVHIPEVQVLNLLPNSYGPVFHPQILLHAVIANLIIYKMINLNEQNHGYSAIPEVLNITACAYILPLSTLKTSSTTATNVPGQGVVPGCAYVIASNIGPPALCLDDYYNCG